MDNELLSRAIDALLVAAIFAGNAVVALGGLQPLLG